MKIAFMKKYVVIKKGLTLIEMVVVISIIIIIGGITVPSLYQYYEYQNNMDVDLCNNSITALITNGKQYCRDNQISAYVRFDIMDDCVEIFSKDEHGNKNKIEKFILPNKFILCDTNFHENKIEIDKRGILNDAGTISFIDRKGKTHNISVYVGSTYVEIK